MYEQLLSNSSNQVFDVANTLFRNAPLPLINSVVSVSMQLSADRKPESSATVTSCSMSCSDSDSKRRVFSDRTNRMRSCCR